MPVMFALKSFSVAVAVMAPIAAYADFAPIKSKSEFIETVTGKQLTMLGVKVRVTPGGAIRGRAYGYDVRGSWKWDGGFFCRSIDWGGTDIGYNCQQVSSNGAKVRFRSDRGTGQSASLTIR